MIILPRWDGQLDRKLNLPSALMHQISFSSTSSEAPWPLKKLIVQICKFWISAVTPCKAPRYAEQPRSRHNTLHQQFLRLRWSWRRLPNWNIWSCLTRCQKERWRNTCKPVSPPFARLSLETTDWKASKLIFCTFLGGGCFPLDSNSNCWLVFLRLVYEWGL